MERRGENKTGYSEKQNYPMTSSPSSMPDSDPYLLAVFISSPLKTHLQQLFKESS